MQLGQITKRDKRNTAMWKKLDDDVIVIDDDNIWRHCHFSNLWINLGAIQKLESKRMVSKTYIFINSKLLS